MKISLRSILLASCTALLLSACGGGGGGGGTSKSQSASTGIRVLHGAIDGSPVDVLSSASAQTVVQGTRFGESSLYGALNEGPQGISLTRALSPSDTLTTAQITVAANERRSLLIYGDNLTFGLKTSLFIDNPGAMAPGQSKLRVVHALVGAGAIEVLIDGALSSGVNFGLASEYLAVGAGLHTVSIQRSSDKKSVFSGTLTFSSEGAYTLLATGEVDYFVTVPLYQDFGD